MIQLFQPPAAWGIPNISPACIKLETWLRMVGLPYQTSPGDLGSAPKGKVPYIEDDGVRLGDSTLIIEHLKNKYDKDLDRGLSDSERAIALAFRRMLKENTYWVIVYSRWADENNWRGYREVMKEVLVPNHPKEVQEQIMESVRSMILGELKGHGLGRHSSAEIYEIGVADLRAVADFLGDKPFFMGEHATLVDATVYAHLVSLISVPIENPAKHYGVGRRNLVEYVKRMQDRFFPQ